MTEDVRFTGRVRLRASTQAEVLGRVDGVYRWVEPDQPGARIEGSFVVPRGNNPGHFNPFGHFNVAELRGRACILEIAGVGWSPVRLYCTRPATSIVGVGSNRWRVRDETEVEFRAWSGPVPILRNSEIARILWTAAYDALQEAGHADLAAACRTASATLAGFPSPPDVVVVAEDQLSLFEPAETGREARHG